MNFLLLFLSLIFSQLFVGQSYNVSNKTLLRYETDSSQYNLTEHVEFYSASVYDLYQTAAIDIAAIGRVAKLGELYDARSDQFMHLSLFSSSLPNISVYRTENKETNLKFTMINTYDEKFNQLDVSASLKLSVLGGLFSLEGSGKFFKDTKTSAKSAKATLINSIMTEYNDFSILSNEAKGIINFDILEQIDATHVVVGVQYGGNVFVSVEDTNQDSQDQMSVSGALKAKLTVIAASIEGQAEVKFSESEKKAINQFSFEVYGDILPNETPETLIEAIKFMKEAPVQLVKANNGRGKAMKYSLIPLTILRKFYKKSMEINSIVNQVDEATIQSCVKVFDDMSLVEQEINDIVDEVNQYTKFISSAKVNRIRDLQYNFRIYQTEVKKNLSEHLIMVRSGKEEVYQLQNIMLLSKGNPYSVENIRKISFAEIKQEIGFIKLLIKLNVTLLSKDDTLDEYLLDKYNNHTYILFYDTEVLSNATRTLRSIIENINDYGANVSVAAAKYEVLNENSQQISDTQNLTKISIYNKGYKQVDNYLIDDKPYTDTLPTLWSFYQMQQFLTQHKIDFEQHKLEYQEHKQEFEAHEKDYEKLQQNVQSHVQDYQQLLQDFNSLKSEYDQNKQNAQQNQDELQQKQQEQVQQIQTDITTATQNIDSIKSDLSTATQNIDTIKNNPVPSYFVYIQLPNRNSPQDLWPNLQWEDITSEYAGLFFRAEGGGSESFGNTQEENSPRLTNVYYDNTNYGYQQSISISPNGQWSQSVTSGGYDGGWVQMSFIVSSGEVRPKNQAVRIWKRTG